MTDSLCWLSMQKHKESSPYTQLQGLIWLGLHLLQKTHSQKNRDINDMKSHFCLLLLYFGLEMFPERTMGWRLSLYTMVPLGSCGTLTMWDPEDKISSLKICPLRVCWNPSPLLYTTLFPGCMNSINFSAIHSSLRYGPMHQAPDAPGWNYPPLKHLKLWVKYTFPIDKLLCIRYFYRDKKPADTFSSTWRWAVVQQYCVTPLGSWNFLLECSNFLIRDLKH